MHERKLTHPAWVWTSPRSLVQYSLKNWGIEIPRKSERPVMMRFLIEFMLVNWRKDNPTEPACRKHENLSKVKRRSRQKDVNLDLSYQRVRKEHSTVQQILEMVWMQKQLQISLHPWKVEEEKVFFSFVEFKKSICFSLRKEFILTKDGEKYHEGGWNLNYSTASNSS